MAGIRSLKRSIRKAHNLPLNPNRKIKSRPVQLSPRVAWKTITPMPEWIKKALTPKALRKAR
jgi:hypothetical protein